MRSRSKFCLFRPTHFGDQFHNSKGLTLIELIVSLSIFMVISGILFSTIFSVQGSYIKGVKRAEMQQHARRAVDRMSRELRMVGSGNKVLPDTLITELEDELPISIAETDTIRFIFVENWDSIVPTVKRVTYYRSPNDSTLRRIEGIYNFGTGNFVNDLPVILSRDISELQFRYFSLADGEDEYFPPIFDADSLDAIQKVEVRVESFSKKGEIMVLTNDIRLRSR